MTLEQSLSLFLVALAAAVLPGLSRVVRLPASVMEILFGVVLGKSLLDLQVGGSWLEFLAQLGFLMLMFHSGMEIDFHMLLQQGRTQVWVQVLVFGATLSLSLSFSLFLGFGGFMALVMATTSLGLVMPALKEAGVSRTPFGQNLLVAASLADFLTLLGITFFVLWHQFGLNWHFFMPLPLFLAFAVLLWAGRLWVWWHPEQAEHFLGSDDSQELGVRFSLALLFLFVALSELVHLEPALGAFMGGCVLSFLFREKEELENKLSALGLGFLVPIFFIHVGMQFDLKNVLARDQLLLAVQLLVAAFAVKVLPSLLFRIQGMDFRSTLQAGALLSSRLSLIVAAATIGVKEGLIGTAMKDAIVLLALLTCLLGPTLFKLTHRQSARSATTDRAKNAPRRRPA